MISYPSVHRLAAIIKRFPGCHIDPAKNALKAWHYCGKEKTRVEGPLQHGLPPAAKNVKGDTKARNAMIMEYGALKAMEEGLVPIEKFKNLQQSLDLVQVQKKEAKTIDGALHNEWHYGPAGTGKSRTVREKWPDAFIKSNDVWWDGYSNEKTVIIEEYGPKQIGIHHLK